jgi:tetratricopeptide (TPR) repeat protein
MNWWTDRQRRKSLLNAFQFDTSCWPIEKNNRGLLEWSNGYGDTLRATVRDNLSATHTGSQSLESLRTFYRNEAGVEGGGIVSVDRVIAGGVRCVVVIQKRRGRLEYHYKGSLIVPLKNCEYRLSIDSEERGVSGERDTLLAGHLAQRGELEMDLPSATQGCGKVVGWFQDPYDADYIGIMTNAMSDDDRLDYFLPDHPLSKVRKYLKEIQSTLVVDSTLAGDFLPVFEHPATEDFLSHPRRLISSSAVASLYMGHGLALSQAGRYAEAANIYEIAIRELQLDGGRDRVLHAQLLHHAGIAYNCLRQYSDAETALSVARGVLERTFGDEDTQTASAAMNLALVYLSQDRHDEAEPLLAQTLKVFLEKDPQGSNAAVAINGLGLVHQKREQYVQAIAEFERALEIFERVRGADFIGCQVVLKNMSLVFRKKGDVARAEEALNRARSRRKV